MPSRSRADGARSTAATRLWRVCVTGPESTGKTMLAARLAARFGTLATVEASRPYAEAKGAPLDVTDVAPIARAQCAEQEAAERAVRARGGSLVVLDTDLVSTVIYGRDYYHAVPPWVLRAERAHRADLYLLCAVDVPWIADGVRDRPGDRDTLWRLFDAALRRRRARVVQVAGDWDARWRVAESAVLALPRRAGE